VRRRSIEARALVRLSGRRDLPDLLPDNDAFWSHVRRLPRRQAQAAALRYVYDLAVADIALTMGCSEGAAKVHLGRGRAALTRSLGMSEEDAP
jgi:DNA-directed RNA polymerase specialized sigma24 family protein